MVYSQRTPPRETPEEADRRPGRESGEAAGQRIRGGSRGYSFEGGRKEAAKCRC